MEERHKNFKEFYSRKIIREATNIDIMNWLLTSDPVINNNISKNIKNLMIYVSEVRENLDLLTEKENDEYNYLLLLY